MHFPLFSFFFFFLPGYLYLFLVSPFLSMSCSSSSSLGKRSAFVGPGWEKVSTFFSFCFSSASALALPRAEALRFNWTGRLNSLCYDV